MSLLVEHTGTGYVHTTAMETEHRARSLTQSYPDDEAPTGTLKINNATTTTTSRTVTLNLTATDNLILLAKSVTHIISCE